ncbi:hypothetical protein N7523_010279 [Penicillium sp. IBT 18751x]|nr:hypothetical protein N7523_010266 [Penicillium sp. IBT 18751x]KAJ6105205.1 hypothetical protein N7523_010279 [Penicillium sp. IBT 18751x]
MTLTSNERRAQRRKECREALAAHIRKASLTGSAFPNSLELMSPLGERVGLVVPPNRVRLQPSVEDGYAWSVSKSKEHLLRTNLSNGTVGIYQAIQQELGRSIEAVDPQTLRPTGPSQKDEGSEEPIKSFETGTGSFTATIQRLERENHELLQQLERAQTRAEELLAQDGEWQAKTCALQEQLRNSQLLAEELEKELDKARGGIVGAIKMLQGHQSPGTNAPFQGSD